MGLIISVTPNLITFFYKEGRISEEDFEKYLLATDDYLPKLCSTK